MQYNYRSVIATHTASFTCSLPVSSPCSLPASFLCSLIPMQPFSLILIHSPSLTPMQSPSLIPMQSPSLIPMQSPSFISMQSTQPHCYAVLQSDSNAVEQPSFHVVLPDSFPSPIRIISTNTHIEWYNTIVIYRNNISNSTGGAWQPNYTHTIIYTRLEFPCSHSQNKVGRGTCLEQCSLGSWTHRLCLWDLQTLPVEWDVRID